MIALPTVVPLPVPALRRWINMTSRQNLLKHVFLLETTVIDNPLDQEAINVRVSISPPLSLCLPLIGPDLDARVFALGGDSHG